MQESPPSKRAVEEEFRQRVNEKLSFWRELIGMSGVSAKDQEVLLSTLQESDIKDFIQHEKEMHDPEGGWSSKHLYNSLYDFGIFAIEKMEESLAKTQSAPFLVLARISSNQAGIPLTYSEEEVALANLWSELKKDARVWQHQ